MLRQTEKQTGQAKRVQPTGENRREARRVRECRDFESALSKGYRNHAIENFLKR
jgi:hypothetical protein